MQQNRNKCINRGAASLKCRLCGTFSKMNGKTAKGSQRYKCTSCNKTYISDYSSKAYIISASSITTLVKESCGIRSISRILKISATTVMRRILAVARSISKPFVSMYKAYEVDELRTYYKSKGRLLWLVYALQKDTKQVIDFAIGSRTKATLQKVISTLSLSSAERIYTDKLNLYTFLIPAYLHNNSRYGTNNIERKNLSLRTHLK